MHLIDQELELMIHGKFSEAWNICEQLHTTIPQDLRHQFNRGWFLLNQGKFQEGFQTLESGRYLSVYGSPRIKTNKQIWNGVDSLEGKTVIMNMEGGYGDMMIHIRFAKDIKNRGGKCIVCCHPDVRSLFSRIEGVYKCIDLNELYYTYHDYWIPAFSAGWLTGNTYETLYKNPYIIPNKNSVDLWTNIIKSDKLKVGIRWSGSPEFEHQQFRIFPAENVIDLHIVSDKIQLYSLQRDNDIKELPDEVIDLQNLLISWEDTAAAISNLDLVITSCTSIAHLSAAMGKPTWIIVPILPYHVWAYGKEHSPWYSDTTKIYRQTEFGNWNEPFVNIKNDLIEFIGD